MVIEIEFIRLAEKRRRALGLTIEQLATRVGISDRIYQYYLAGAAQPTIGTAMRMAAVLQIDLNALRDSQVPDDFGNYHKPGKDEKKEAVALLK